MKRDNRKWLLKALDEGPYVFKIFTPEGSTIPRLQTAEDLEGDDLLLQDAEMEQEMVHNNSEDPLVSAMLLLAKAITQNISNPTNNRLRAIQSNNQNSINHSKGDSNTSTVQCYNCSGKGHYARNCPKPRVRELKYFMEQMLLAKQDEAGRNSY
ncbi:retrovirus-related pol polyprotein from transposon TNT 1-94 [Tanacetum coccineum]